MAANLPPPAKMTVDDRDNIASNWKMFRKEWEDYEVASELSGKDEKIRVATLRIVMGRECAAILDNLDLTAAQAKKVTAILDALEQNFEPVRNVIYERSVFYSAKQSVGESISQYVNRLRKLAASCEFTPQRVLDENIRDKLVLGVLDKALKKQLLKDPKLTLVSAIETCRAAEQIDTEMANLSGNDEVASEERVNRLQRSMPIDREQSMRPRSRANNHSTTDSSVPSLKQCKYCGGKHKWDKNKCPAFGRKCNKCGKQNHFAKVCLMQRVNAAQETTSQDDDSSEEAVF